MKDIEKLALEAACGNAAAADFLTGIVEVLHLWDDLIDRDRPVTDAHVTKVFTNMLVNIPLNPFFAANVQRLTPVLMVAIQNWRVANDAERGHGGRVPMEAAFVLRSSYVDLITMTATICGGFDHGHKVAKAVRELAHAEGYEMYLRNLAAEAQAREG